MRYLPPAYKTLAAPSVACFLLMLGPFDSNNGMILQISPLRAFSVYHRESNNLYSVFRRCRWWEVQSLIWDSEMIATPSYPRTFDLQ
jgi:hypothetical protein